MPKSLQENLNLCFTITNPPQSPPKSIFNSLYDPTVESTSTSNSFAHFTSGDISGNLSGELSSTDSEAGNSTFDFSAIQTSRRFFFASPGISNSIVDSTLSTEKSLKPEVIGGSIAVPKLSPDPYSDFRKSMEEMVEARDESIDVIKNWDYLHELLTCYLSLNPKSTHKYIMQAFADLLVNLLP